MWLYAICTLYLIYLKVTWIMITIFLDPETISRKHQYEKLVSVLLLICQIKWLYYNSFINDTVFYLELGLMHDTFLKRGWIQKRRGMIYMGEV